MMANVWRILEPVEYWKMKQDGENPAGTITKGYSWCLGFETNRHNPKRLGDYVSIYLLRPAKRKHP